MMDQPRVENSSKRDFTFWLTRTFQKLHLFFEYNPFSFIDGFFAVAHQHAPKILYSQLTEYNKDLTEENVEEASATFCSHLIVGTVTAFKGQSGLIYVWDPVINRIVHATRGDFAVKAIKLLDKVFSLHYVSYWGKTPEFVLRVENFERMSPQTEPSWERKICDELRNHPYPENGRIDMVVDHGKLNITVGNDCYSVQI